MSISSEITRISNAKTAIAESIANKGVTVPSGTKIDGMAALIDSIQTGGAAIQPSKALTVTSNGTTTITPDAPYDAIKQVDLTVNVASGGGGSAGYKVTFPATAKNWNKVAAGGIVQVDGTVIDIIDYSTLAGKTIPNVIEICVWGSAYYCQRATVQTGKILVTQNNLVRVQSHITADGESSFTPMGDGSLLRWTLLADTVISSIEMYNTD